MTARTVTRQSLKDLDEKSDDDSISITSTQHSDVDYERSYIVDRILAEEYSEDNDEKLFLICWEGYELTDSTWEPAQNIQNQVTFRRVECRKNSHR
jgi:hypothetical protein